MENNIKELTVNLNTDNPISQDLTNQCDAGTMGSVPCVQIGTDVLSGLVPENELAVDEPDETEEALITLTDAEKLGCFSPSVGMAQITGMLNDRLFALHHIDEQGNHIFKFCERYENGTISPQMSITQGELFLLNKCGFNVKSITIPTLRAKATQIMSNLTLDYFNKFCGSEPIDMERILQVLMQVRDQLPIHKDLASECNSKEFYQKVLQAMKNCSTFTSFWGYSSHKSYYTLNNEAMGLLAEEMGLKVKDLLKKLHDYGFLYLTKSSAGLKTKVRFKGIEQSKSKKGDAFREEFDIGDSYTDWAYCIWKLQNIGELRK